MSEGIWTCNTHGAIGGEKYETLKVDRWFLFGLKHMWEREREREREVLRFDGGQEFQPPTPLYYELGGLSY